MTQPEGASARPRRVLAVDWGDRRTGLAATDWTGAIALPLPRLDERDPAELVRRLAAIVADRQTELVVLGMPLLVDGRAGERAARTVAFLERLRSGLPCPVETVDESHSTDEAHERLGQGGLKAARRRELADSIAALVILERWRSLPWPPRQP